MKTDARFHGHMSKTNIYRMLDARFRARISSEKALKKIEEFLERVNQMLTMGYSEEDNLREELNVDSRCNSWGSQ